MKKPNIVIIGAGGHTKSCIDVIVTEDKFNIIGLVGLADEIGNDIYGFKVIGTDNDLSEIYQNASLAVIGLGHFPLTDRSDLYKSISKIGFTFPNIFSNDSYVSPFASIGTANIFMRGTIVNAGAIIGSNCIINSRSLIEHDVQVGDNCHISTGAIINGNVCIKDNTFVGSGAIIKNGITVGENSVIGMGLSVRHDLEANSIFTG
mgnify:CR=1 FL=1